MILVKKLNEQKPRKTTQSCLLGSKNQDERQIKTKLKHRTGKTGKIFLKIMVKISKKIYAYRRCNL